MSCATIHPPSLPYVHAMHVKACNAGGAAPLLSLLTDTKFTQFVAFSKTLKGRHLHQLTCPLPCGPRCNRHAMHYQHTRPLSCKLSGAGARGCRPLLAVRPSAKARAKNKTRHKTICLLCPSMSEVS
eukprot:365009-Chlamydomonas_euryale.AAC.1